MADKTTRVCCVCHQSFLKEQMAKHASPRSKTMNWYCRPCLEEKESRERFSDKVCQIFGIKGPGPRIWTERKRLQDNYGYSDDTIIACLDYIYNEKKMKKLSESLALVTPSMVDEMMTFKRREQRSNDKVATAAATQINYQLVSFQKPKEREKEILNPDDFL